MRKNDKKNSNIDTKASFQLSLEIKKINSKYPKSYKSAKKKTKLIEIIKTIIEMKIKISLFKALLLPMSIKLRFRPQKR